MSHTGLPATWLQVNVALQRHDGDASVSARTLFSRLSPFFDEWRQRNLFKRFFFLRKPPDLRLRFLGQDTEGELLLEMQKVLSGLQHDGFVQHFFCSVYEPEVFQFGGPEAMEHVHGHFDADSAAWIALDQLGSCGRRTVPPDVLAVAVMNDLFYQTLACGAEVWDVWCNLKSLLPEAPAGTEPVVPVVLVEDLLSQVSNAEAPILKQYLRANQELATGLVQVWNDGKLQCGLRALFPFIAMYHFNRHGFGGAKQAALAQAMSQAWNPKLGMRGAEAGPRPQSMRAGSSKPAR